MPTAEEISAKIIESRILANRKARAVPANQPNVPVDAPKPEGLLAKLRGYASGLSVDIPRIPAEYDPKSTMSQAGLGLSPDQQLAANLISGGAGMVANMPAFIADILLNPKQLSPVAKGEAQIPPILKEIVRPAAKLAAGTTVRGESKAGQELYKEAKREAFEHPEGPLLPFLIALGGPKAVKKMGGRIRGAKHKVKPVDIVKKVDPIKSPHGDIPAVEVRGKTYVKEAGKWQQPASGKELPSHLLKDAEAVTKGVTEVVPKKDVRLIPMAPRSGEQLPATPKSKPAITKKKPTSKAQQDAFTAQEAAINDMIDVLEEQKLKPTTRLNPAKVKALDAEILELGRQKKDLFDGKAPLVEIEPAKTLASDIDASIQRVTQTLKEAKPVRKTQEALYSQERGSRLAKMMAVRKKVSGEKGFHAEKGALKGELPKIEFESIRDKISQADIDNLFKKVVDADILTEFEKITAREGLAKIFGEHGGRVPTKGELTLLEQVFPAKFIETAMSKGPLWGKIKEGLLQAANVPRSMMSSFDVSFGLRQGAFAAPRYRKAFWNSWKKQFKIFGSEKAYRASREALVADKDFKFAKGEGKISFTEVGKILSRREESFQSQWAEKIPLIGRGVRASGRAYTAFANQYRLDIFKKIVKDFEAQGLKPRENPYLTRKIGDFVNNATGRGSLGQFENAAIALNATFFSPRLNIARMRLLNPVYYIKQPKHLRKQALLTALSAAGTATTILTIAKLGGLDVTADPRNADFGKIKIGNTRLDMLAGFGQFVRGAAQITTGQYVSSSTGKTVTLGEGYRPLTRMDILIRQIESKEAPVASFATGLLRGKNWAGEDFSIPKEVAARFVPMVVADMADIIKDDPTLLPLAVPAIFGIGLQTYKQKRKAGFGLGRSLGK